MARYVTLIRFTNQGARAISKSTARALVVERHDSKTSRPEILGVGRLSKLHGSNEAEFALTISDQWQGRGLGTQLLKMLVQAGRDERLWHSAIQNAPTGHRPPAQRCGNAATLGNETNQPNNLNEVVARRHDTDKSETATTALRLGIFGER